MTVHATFDPAGLPTGFWPDDVFPPAGGKPSAAVPADAVEISAADWTALRADAGKVAYVGGKVAPYAPPVDLKAYAAASRYARETAGITVAGVKVATDQGSQAKIGNAYLLLQASGAASLDFKGSDGTFVSLSSDQFKGLALAVGAHVQACFAVEAQVHADIASGKVTAAAQIDAAFAAVAGAAVAA